MTQHLSHSLPFTVPSTNHDVHNVKPTGRAEPDSSQWFRGIHLTSTLPASRHTCSPGAPGFPQRAGCCLSSPTSSLLRADGGRGMGSKSDKAVPSPCLLLSQLDSQRPCRLRLPFTCSAYHLFNLQVSSVCLIPPHCAGLTRGHRRAAWLCNNSPDVVVPALGLGSVLTPVQDHSSRRPVSQMLNPSGRKTSSHFPDSITLASWI